MILAFLSAILGWDEKNPYADEIPANHAAAAGLHRREQIGTDRGRAAATVLDEHDSIQDADSKPTGRNGLATCDASTNLSRAPAATAADQVTTRVSPSPRSCDPRSNRADAAAIDGALTDASEAVKSIIVKILDHVKNRGKRKRFVAATKALVEPLLQTALAGHGDGAAVVADTLGAWRISDARAVLLSTVMRAACDVLNAYWDRQHAALVGGHLEADSVAVWLDHAVHALRDTMERYDHDPRIRGRAIVSGDPTRHLIVGPEAKHSNRTAALVSVVKAVTLAMLDVLAKDFQLHVGWGDYMDLIRRVVLPSVECFFATKMLDLDWTFTFAPPSSLFSPMTMADPPHELDWHVDESDLTQRVRVVVLSTFPGIPFRFGVDETVLHRAEVVVVTVPSPLACSAALVTAEGVDHEVPHIEPNERVTTPVALDYAPSSNCCLPTPSFAPAVEPAHEPGQSAASSSRTSTTSLSASRPLSATFTASVLTQSECVSNAWIAQGAAEIPILAANLYALTAAPIALNLPPQHIPTYSSFHSHTDLHAQLAKVDHRLALLRAEVLPTTITNRISDRVQVLLADHQRDIRAFLGPLHRIPTSPNWQVLFLCNLYTWFRLVVTARMVGCMLAVPRAGEAAEMPPFTNLSI
ncbi:hypothetical protein GGF31_003797 [Allomyces arbusculus]|nr:hypothetical protein GGF31_003797 [Allomyces arbusculus]